MKKDDVAAEREAIESILYSAYSIILEELLDQAGESAAHLWLSLTAQGMRRSTPDVAASIYSHNQRFLTRKRSVTED